MASHALQLLFDFICQANILTHARRKAQPRLAWRGSKATRRYSKAQPRYKRGVKRPYHYCTRIDTRKLAS